MKNDNIPDHVPLIVSSSMGSTPASEAYEKEGMRLGRILYQAMIREQNGDGHIEESGAKVVKMGS